MSHTCEATFGVTGRGGKGRGGRLGERDNHRRAVQITAARDAPASQFRRLVVNVIERAEQDWVGPALLASTG